MGAAISPRSNRLRAPLGASNRIILEESERMSLSAVNDHDVAIALMGVTRSGAPSAAGGPTRRTRARAPSPRPS